MKHAIRLPARPQKTRSFRTKGAFVTLSFLLCPIFALAALTEYQMRFSPSPSAGAVGYTLHLGTESGSYRDEFDLGNPNPANGEIVYAVSFEDSVDLFLAVSAYDDDGESSPLSNEMRVAAVEAAPPALPPEPPMTPSEGPGIPSDEPPASGPGDGGPDNGGGSDPGQGDSGGGDEVPVPPLGESTFLGVTASVLGEIDRLGSAGESRLLTVDSLAAPRDLRPARCDLDGDGDSDLLLGFGTGSAGEISLIYLEAGAVVGNDSLTAGSRWYRNNRSGMTYPACGDIDGDGLNEIVVGFDSQMSGRIQIFDDHTTGFSPFQSISINSAGFMRLQSRNESRLALYPALGDVDGDGRDELVFGSGAGEGSRLFILDDAEEGFAKHPAMNSPRNEMRPMPHRSRSNPDDMERRVAIGDVDGDGIDELALSFGSGGARQMMVYDDFKWVPSDMTTGLLGMMVTGRESDGSDNGAVRIALGDVDQDGIDEFILGFEDSAAGELQVLDDLIAGRRPLFTVDGFVSSADSNSNPIVPAPF